MSKELLQAVIDSGAADDPLTDFFYSVSDHFSPITNKLIPQNEQFPDATLFGEINFSPVEKLALVRAQVTNDLSERSGKKAQYEYAKKVLKSLGAYDGGIFIFKGSKKQFRFSLVYAQYQGTKRDFSNFRRFTYFVVPGKPYKTFLDRVAKDYSSLEAIKDAFSVEKVNKEFYKQIAQFFYRLTGKDNKPRELELPDNGSANPRFLEEYSVRLIGRIIFCWFLKHKHSTAGIPLIPEDVLSVTALKADYYHSTLERLFFDVMNKPVSERKPETAIYVPNHREIPFLNGGLFEPHSNDYFTEGYANPSLKIPNKWFLEFYQLLEQYNFTIDENTTVDSEVSVDPEMMGRIFENLLAEVNPETGETARKATGSYYTPRVIVDYMVEQSLKQYLITKTSLSEAQCTNLLSYEVDVVEWSDEEKQDAVKAFKEIKIIDPACGSGAFPMGILHRMILALEKVDPILQIWRREYLHNYHPVMRRIVEDKLRKGNEQYIRKLTIVQDSVYGVDIQPIAVEIAKLRCFLSLIVDESVIDNEENRGIEALPNLEFKFVAANSLIALPKMARQSAFGVTETIDKLKELRESYLRSFASDKKQIEILFRATQRKLFEENVSWALSDTLVKQLTDWDPFSYKSCSWFAPEWMFGVTEGFDVVIANPPYIKEYINRDAFEGVRNSPYYQGKMDIWYMFACQGIDRLKSKGTLTFIAQNNWVTSYGASILRNKVIAETKVLALLDFGDYKIFETSGIQTMVMVFQKDGKTDNYKFDYRRVLADVVNYEDILDLLNCTGNSNLEYLSPNMQRDKFADNDLPPSVAAPWVRIPRPFEHTLAG